MLIQAKPKSDIILFGAVPRAIVKKNHTVSPSEFFNLLPVIFAAYYAKLNLMRLGLAAPSSQLSVDLGTFPFSILTADGLHIGHQALWSVMTNGIYSAKILSMLRKSMAYAESVLEGQLIPLAYEAVRNQAKNGDGYLEKSLKCFYGFLGASYMSVVDYAFDLIALLNYTLPHTLADVEATVLPFKSRNRLMRSGFPMEITMSIPMHDVLAIGGQFGDLIPNRFMRHTDYDLRLFHDRKSPGSVINLLRPTDNYNIHFVATQRALCRIACLNGHGQHYAGYDKQWYELRGIPVIDRFAALLATETVYASEIVKFARLHSAYSSDSKCNLNAAIGELRMSRAYRYASYHRWHDQLREMLRRCIISQEGAELLHFMASVLRLNEERRVLYSVAANHISYVGRRLGLITNEVPEQNRSMIFVLLSSCAEYLKSRGLSVDFPISPDGEFVFAGMEFFNYKQ